MPCALQIRPWKPSKENSAVLPENPLLQFEVYAADRDGAFCFGDSSMVQVTTDGGVLLGIENGNAADCTEYASSCRRLYHGRLIFYVRRSFADHPGYRAGFFRTAKIQFCYYFLKGVTTDFMWEILLQSRSGQSRNATGNDDSPKDFSSPVSGNVFDESDEHRQYFYFVLLFR